LSGRKEQSAQLDGSAFDRVDLRASEAVIDAFIPIGIAGLICPLLSGPKSMLFWIAKETWNAIEEAQAGGDYRQAA
jgi:hypothetical protein